MTELTPEQIQQYKESFERMQRYDERLKIADNLNREKLDELVDLVNEIFARNNVVDRIDKSHIRFNADYIGNIVKIDDKKLSEIIFNEIYPKPTLKLYSHFTNFNAACSILKNKELWLFNLINNFGADEFRLFYEEHNIDGYKHFKETFGIKTDYRSLMSEIFSLCLTSDNNTSPDLWNYFGYSGTGIKLTFEIESKIPDFREVYYSNKDNPQKIPFLADLFDTILSKYNYPLNFTYISKIGAFYIHGKFDNEQEYRFLVKRTSDIYNAWDFVPVVFNNDITYIVLPFSSRLAEFKLKKVTKGPRCSDTNFDIIKSILQTNYTDTIDIEE
ncbi:hypothetical protein [Arsenicibacter rosenii]|nr:hypothetical protein [Arsenicibacter rosenii]